MKPSTMFGWVVVVASICGVAWLNLHPRQIVETPALPATPVASAPPPETAPAPSYSATVESFVCEERGDDTRAEVTLKNSGPVAIPVPKVYFRFSDGNMRDALTDPVMIPPGARATAFVRNPGRSNCEIASMQDKDGNPVTLSKS